MHTSTKRIVIKFLISIMGALIYQSVFAGVKTYFDVKNLTPDFNKIVFYPVTPDNQGKIIELQSGQKADKIDYVNAPYSYNYTSYNIQRSVFIKSDIKEIKVCDIIFMGETYWSVKNGGGNRMRNESVLISNKYSPENNYTCKADLSKTFEGGVGDTEYISISLIGNMPHTIAASAVRNNFKYYDVTCINGSKSTFWVYSGAPCFVYGNGKSTYSPTNTCSSKPQKITKEDLDVLVGNQFCKDTNK